MSREAYPTVRLCVFPFVSNENVLLILYTFSFTPEYIAGVAVPVNDNNPDGVWPFMDLDIVNVFAELFVVIAFPAVIYVGLVVKSIVNDELTAT